MNERLAVLLSLLVFSSAAAQDFDLRLVPGLPEPGREPTQWKMLVLVTSKAGDPQTVTPEINAAGARLVSLHPSEAKVARRRPALFYLHVEAAGEAGAASVTVGLKESPEGSRSCRLPLGIDLALLPWESWWAGKESRLEQAKALPPAEAKWQPIRLPKSWQDPGVTWVRTRFRIPSAWRGSRLCVFLRAVDDRDIAFLNGRQIGRTDGWDRERKYPLPADVVRWGDENELCIAVHNVYAGGGIYRMPIFLSTEGAEGGQGLFAQGALQNEKDRTPAGEIGPRLPFRRMIVRDGVLRYEDGKEVALWGVNYYPQSWWQYESLKKLGVEHRRSVDEDVEDLARMGIDIIRIHVFDTEITDGKGNLICNDHLDVLDYLIAQCSKRGICLMLTPIAWWGSPSARPDSFSQYAPKQALTLWPAMWAAQINYVRQFLNHKNPYTGRRIVDEPCLCLFEIINEPTYWHFGEIMTGKPDKIRLNPEADARAIAGVRKAFERAVPSTEWLTPTAYEYFRYATVRRYIDTMIETMRDAGARQPIAYSGFLSANAGIVQAIGDSSCDAVTLGMYPGGLKPPNDNINLLHQLDNSGLDSRLAKKARLVYEFDAPGTIRRVSMYPAMARRWRNVGVQVACQFQYDARATVHVNWDWDTHYLNLWHTPEKMVSFLIGGEVFRRLPRGATFPTPPSDQVFPPGAVSYEKNAALLCAPDCYMQARPTDWRPMDAPENPKRILSVGTCPFFEYEGAGVVDLRFEDGTADLRIYPDVERLRDGLRGTVEKPLTKLHEGTHPFRIRLPAWKNAKVERHQDGHWVSVPGNASQFMAGPGTYRLLR